MNGRTDRRTDAPFLNIPLKYEILTKASPGVMSMITCAEKFVIRQGEARGEDGLMDGGVEGEREEVRTGRMRRG